VRRGSQSRHAARSAARQTGIAMKSAPPATPDELLGLSQQVITLLLECELLASDLSQYSVEDPNSQQAVIAKVNDLAAQSRHILQQHKRFSWFSRAHVDLFGRADPLGGQHASYHDLAFVTSNYFVSELLIHPLEPSPGRYVVPQNLEVLDVDSVSAIADSYGNSFGDVPLWEVRLRREAAAAGNLTGPMAAKNSPPNCTLPEVDLALNQIRYDGNCFNVTPDAALLVQKLVEAHPQFLSASGLFTRPSDLKNSLPAPIKSLIQSKPGSGYRIVM
jgi:hypothetical protein